MNDTFKLAVRLMLFALIAALLLAFVNAVTKDKIAENTAAKVNEARAAVIGDYEFSEAGFEFAAPITGVYAAKDGETLVGWVYEIENKGYGGAIRFSVGILADGTIAGVAVSSHSETKGLGTAAETEFLGRFAGQDTGIDAMSVDAMTGATVSSTAVRAGINAALENYRTNTAGEEASAQ